MQLPIQGCISYIYLSKIITSNQNEEVTPPGFNSPSRRQYHTLHIDLIFDIFMNRNLPPTYTLTPSPTSSPTLFSTLSSTALTNPTTAPLPRKNLHLWKLYQNWCPPQNHFHPQILTQLLHHKNFYIMHQYHCLSWHYFLLQL